MRDYRLNLKPRLKRRCRGDLCNMSCRVDTFRKFRSHARLPGALATTHITYDTQSYYSSAPASIRLVRNHPRERPHRRRHQQRRDQRDDSDCREQRRQRKGLVQARHLTAQIIADRGREKPYAHHEPRDACRCEPRHGAEADGTQAQLTDGVQQINQREPHRTHAHAIRGASRMMYSELSDCHQLAGNARPAISLRVLRCAKRLSVDPACSNRDQNTVAAMNSTVMAMSCLRSAALHVPARNSHMKKPSVTSRSR